MTENKEKERFKAVTHVIFDVDGMLLGLYNMLCFVHLNVFLLGADLLKGVVAFA